MRKSRLFWGIVMMVGSLTAMARQSPAIIPMPVDVKLTGEHYLLDEKTTIYTADSNAQAAWPLLKSCLQDALALAPAKVEAMGKPFVKTADLPAAPYLLLQTDSLSVRQPEGYLLTIANDHIIVKGHDLAGLIYGIQTLRQCWQPAGEQAVRMRGAVIHDYPRFGYRGMALDVSRHLFSVAFIKQYIDILSLYKFNTFHWHLTDDQGWRIEIKQYPLLQSVAAWRSETLIGHKKELPHRYDGKRYGGYYTQEQVKEIVLYAAERSITVIPEIEMPGHASAALAAYPWLGCTGGPYATAKFWGVFEDVFCAGKESTFLFLQNVLDEVLPLFPAPYVHIGGDECPKTRWAACPHCQQRIRSLGLKDEHALQSYFIQRIEKYINNKGKAIIGWDEILEGGLARNATVMSWRGEEGGMAAASQKHPFIMTPEGYFYFDYYQSLQPSAPVAAGNYTPLNKVYRYEPAGRLPDSILAYMAGVEGQAWSEYYTDAAKAMHMIFPRAFALAEVGWTIPAQRNYQQFLERLRAQAPLLQRLSISYNRNFDAPEYKPPIAKHKGIGAVVTLSVPPVERYDPGAAILVNGSKGSSRYNDGQWLGFNNPQVDILVDLKTAKPLQSLQMNVLNYHWQRIWAPERLEFWAGNDTQHLKKVYVQQAFPVNGVNTVNITLKPFRARYIKVIAYNKATIPAGEYGAGGKPLLLTDELFVR